MTPSEKGHLFIPLKLILHKHILNRSSQSTRIDTDYSFVSNQKKVFRDKVALFAETEYIRIVSRQCKWNLETYKFFLIHLIEENEWKVYPLFVSMSEIMGSDWFDVFVAFHIVYSMVHLLRNTLILLIFCIDILMPCKISAVMAHFCSS